MERSKNALIILNLIAEKGPKTLYEIIKEKGMRPSSIHLALNILSDQNLIMFDAEESEKRNRNQKVYSLTFKGLVVFLSMYRLPEYRVAGRGSRIREPSETDEEAKSKLLEQLKRDWDTYKPKLDEFKEILRNNGELLSYPLFLHSHSFEHKPAFIPGIYQSFIKIAQAVSKEASSKWLALSGDRFRSEKRKLEKNIKRNQKLFKGRKILTVTTFGGEEKEETFDPVALEKQKLDFAKENLKIVSDRENEFLKESFFMYFLNWYRGYHFSLPNRDLCDYTKMLLEKEKNRFDFTKQLLDKWLSAFAMS